MAQRYNQDYTSTLPRPLPAEVTRTVLLERIARAGDAGLVVLAAPSGYGKTTLLGQLARASKRAAWLTLSDHHADLETLSDDLMVSITQVAKEVTFERVRRAVAEGAQVATLATPFARELDALSVNVKILIDQANLLGSDALAWLESFALALGEGHQLVYCAYDFAPERLAAPLAAGRALLLTAPDLAFSEEEIRSYLTSRGSSADVFEVQQYLEGWPAGIGLAAAGIVHAMPHDELLSAALEQLPKNVRQALPEASVLRVWREADAARLGCHLPTGWLREVRRVGLPLTPLNAQAYRPHTLALALLDRELKGRPERYRELHIQAARGAQQRGDLVTALQHFRQAELTHDALHVAETIIPRLRKRHEYTLVCRLLEPFDIRELSPLLVEEYSYALLLRGQVARSEALLQDLLAQNSGGALTFLVLSYIASRRGEGLLDLKLLEKGITLATDE